MARKIIVVTAAYGNDHVKSLGGQAAVLPFIANAGADGVEIRRELCSAEELNALPSLAASWRRCSASKPPAGSISCRSP